MNIPNLITRTHALYRFDILPTSFCCRRTKSAADGQLALPFSLFFGAQRFDLALAVGKGGAILPAVDYAVEILKVFLAGWRSVALKVAFNISNAGAVIPARQLRRQALGAITPAGPSSLSDGGYVVAWP